MDERSLRARGLPAIAALALWALRTASDRSFLSVVGRLADLFFEVRASADGAEALQTLISHLSIVSRANEDLVGGVAEHLPRALREDFMDLAEMFAEKMKAQGRADLLLKLLSMRFGALNEADEARVREGSIEQLDRWAERVLSAESLAEVWG